MQDLGEERRKRRHHDEEFPQNSAERIGRGFIVGLIFRTLEALTRAANIPSRKVVDERFYIERSFADLVGVEFLRNSTGKLAETRNDPGVKRVLSIF